MAAVEDQQPLETLSADGADEALGERVRVRRAHRCLDHPDAFAGEDGVEATSELGVAVADQEAELCLLLLERPGDLPGLLGDPGPCGVAVLRGEKGIPAIGRDLSAAPAAPRA